MPRRLPAGHQSHDKDQKEPIRSKHVHFFLSENAIAESQAWLVNVEPSAAQAIGDKLPARRHGQRAKCPTRVTTPRDGAPWDPPRPAFGGPLYVQYRRSAGATAPQKPEAKPRRA